MTVEATDPQLSRLAGGLRVVTETDSTSRSVAIGAWVGIGNRDEPAPIAGVSHFLEHLLFKGSTTRTVHDIAEGVDARGGDLNAFTAKEYTAFHARLPAAELDFGIDTLLDVIADPGFTAAQLDAERRVILEELACSEDTPDDVVHTALGAALFPSHPLGWEVIGTAESVRAINHDDVRDFHRQWYTRSNLVVSVVGPMPHDEVVERVEKVWAHIDHGVPPRRIAPSQEVIPRVVTRRPVEQAHVAVGWRGLPMGHPDRFALAVANQVIGGGWSSRLFQRVREERGMAYTVFSSAGSHADAGTLSWYAATSPGRVDELMKVVEAEYADIVANGPSERELEIARGGFEGSTILGLEDSGSRMARLATSLTVRDEIVDIDTQLEAIRAVTAGDVQRVLSAIMGSGTQVVSMVGSAGD